MKKLEKEQLPKVIALGVMTVALLGYASFALLGHGGAPATPAAAATRHLAAAKPAAPAAPNPVDKALALASIVDRTRALTRTGTNPSLEILLHRLNPMLRGWTNYFRHGVSKATFNYLRAFTWRRVVNWLRHKHDRANWKWLRRRYLPGWWPTEGEATLFDPAAVRITYARYRGQITDVTPWATGTIASPA